MHLHEVNVKLHNVDFSFGTECNWIEMITMGLFLVAVFPQKC